MKVILTLLATGLWFLFSHWWYTCKLEQVCYGCAPAAAAAPAVVEPAAVAGFPIDFAPNSAEALTSAGFDELRSRIMSGDDGSNRLEITGYYTNGEPSVDPYENMGVARAAAAAAMIAPNWPTDRLVLRGMERPAGEMRNGRFEATDYRWLAAEGEAVEASTENSAVIRFAFNDATRALDPAIGSYLDDVAARVQKSGERISLVGHTDNVGDEAANQALGRRRAERIKAQLISKGVSADKIITDSQGEVKPVASNDSDEGRALNRRVELNILPPQ